MDSHEQASPRDGASMIRSEEELTVTKRWRPAERLRVRKIVVTEDVQVTVTVRREELHLDREPLSGGTTAGLGAGRDEIIELILSEEVPVVTTRVVPRERIRLVKHVVTEDRPVTETLRQERVDVDTVASEQAAQ